MAKLMSPIPEDKVVSTGVSEIRKQYVKLAHQFLDLVDGKILICHKCGNPVEISGYYTEPRNKTGVTCYCKECIRAMACDFDSKKTNTYIDNEEKAKATLQFLDWPYIDSIYKQAVANAQEDMSERKKRTGWASYVTQIRTFHKDKTWKDSNFGADGGFEEVDSGKRITNKMIKRWGAGFSDNDYLTMEDHYKMLKENNPNADSNQEIFIEDLCRIRLLMLKAMRGEGKSDDFAKYSKTYQETFKQAGLKTVVENDASADETFGVTLAEIEKYTPSEFYRNKELFKDFDGLGDYFTRYVLRPLKNLMLGGSERDSEFSISESE